jgi:hypothetical protein
MNGQCQTGGGGSCTVDVGTCSHSPCVTGAALTEFCDDDFDTFYVCEPFPFGDGLTQCCSTAWDQTCVDDITSNYEDCSGC